MNGDKVILTATGAEENGNVSFEAEASLKPQFMLDEEYRHQIIQCAVLAVKKACEVCYPNNVDTQHVLAEAIANEANKD